MTTWWPVMLARNISIRESKTTMWAFLLLMGG